jgi:transcriptional regulator with XRE-family HTH domain
MKPNHALKFARLDAGLTQEELADVLNINPITIYRWERGETGPNAYFRERLCTIFRRSEQELGLQKEQSEIWLREHSSFLVDPCFPGDRMIPVGQESLLREIASSHHRVIALTGLPGSGKTAIVQALAGLPDIRQSVEGFLWASCGQETKPLRHLQKWLAFLGEKENVQNVEDAQDRLRILLHGRKMLIVLDDLLHVEDILPYQMDSCRYVLTTRLPVVANTIADRLFHPRGLSDSQAFHILSDGLPQTLVREHRSLLRALCQQVGNLPLALEQFGKYLRREARTYSQRRFQDALSHLFQPEVYLYIPPDSCSLASAIKRSEAWLAPSAQRMFFRLATCFPAAPATFTEQKVEEYFTQVPQFHLNDLDQLVDVGLVSVVRKNRYQIHPVIVAYARQRAEMHPHTSA